MGESGEGGESIGGRAGEGGSEFACVCVCVCACVCVCVCVQHIPEQGGCMYIGLLCLYAPTVSIWGR
jgi:hypothetical protein